jgi:hypothetical protein
MSSGVIGGRVWLAIPGRCGLRRRGVGGSGGTTIGRGVSGASGGPSDNDDVVNSSMQVS